MVRRLVVRVMIPSPLRHRLRKRKVQILQPRLERLDRIPVRRMGISFTRRILEIPRRRTRTSMRVRGVRVRIVHAVGSVSAVRALPMRAVYSMSGERAVPMGAMHMDRMRAVSAVRVRPCPVREMVAY